MPGSFVGSVGMLVSNVPSGYTLPTTLARSAPLGGTTVPWAQMEPDPSAPSHRTRACEAGMVMVPRPPVGTAALALAAASTDGFWTFAVGACAFVVGALPATFLVRGFLAEVAFLAIA